MLAQMEPEKFGDTVADVEGIAFTIRQLQGGHTGLCVGLATGRHAGLDSSRVGGRDTWRQIGLCGHRGTG